MRCESARTITKRIAIAIGNPRASATKYPANGPRVRIKAMERPNAHGKPNPNIALIVTNAREYVKDTKSWAPHC